MSFFSPHFLWCSYEFLLNFFGFGDLPLLIFCVLNSIFPSIHCSCELSFHSCIYKLLWKLKAFLCGLQLLEHNPLLIGANNAKYLSQSKYQHRFADTNVELQLLTNRHKFLSFHNFIWKYKCSLIDFFCSKLFFLALSALEIFASVMSQYNHW